MSYRETIAAIEFLVLELRRRENVTTTFSSLMKFYKLDINHQLNVELGMTTRGHMSWERFEEII